MASAGTTCSPLQLIFLHRDEHEQPLLIQITGTSNNPGGMMPAEREAFASVVETLELRMPPNPDDERSGEAAAV
jgi:hypothetical protein